VEIGEEDVFAARRRDLLFIPSQHPDQDSNPELLVRSEG
jgi:hypothetical protein